jgi:hypothetical protein
MSSEIPTCNEPTKIVPKTTNEVNKNEQFLTLSNFPTKNEFVALREKMQINGLLELIKNKILNSISSSVSISMEELKPYTDVMNKVFRNLMSEKEFFIMKTETPNANGGVVSYAYTITW